jgi:hypothetical protein
MTSSRRDFLKLAAEGFLVAALSPDCIVRAQSSDASAPAKDLIDSAKHLGSQFLGNRVGITGMDGATSTLLPSGESLWLFGDTVEGPFESIRKLDLKGLRSSTAAVVPQQDASHGIKQFRFLADETGRRPRQIVPFARDEDPAIHRIWPMHGITVGQHVYLFYHRITLLKGVDVFVNFQLDGMGIARADVSELSFKRLTAPDGTSLFWKGQEPTFGVFVDRSDEHVYLWGSLATGMHLARTRPNSLEDLASYEYLVEGPDLKHPAVSSRWSKHFQPTGKLFDSVPNEMSAAYNAHLRKYVAIHSLHRENKVVMRVAERITGPWSEPQILYRPERAADTDLIYAAKEHPELARNNGRVMYVTYVNSATYVPQLIEVTLS